MLKSKLNFIKKFTKRHDYDMYKFSKTVRNSKALSNQNMFLNFI